MDPSRDDAAASLPIGRSARLETIGLALAGDNAVLVRETGADHRNRALLTTDKLADGERLVVTPLDEEVEVRVDGDALAVWLGSGSLEQLPSDLEPMPATSVPLWASLVGGVLLVAVLIFAVVGSAVVFTWLVRLFS